MMASIVPRRGLATPSVHGHAAGRRVHARAPRRLSGRPTRARRRLLEQVAGVREPGLGVGVAAHHPRELPQPGVALDDRDAARGDASVVGLVHDEVAVGERRHLGEVGDDDDLGVLGEGGEPRPDVERGPAADAGVDLVEDERGRPPASADGLPSRRPRARA